MTLAYRAEFPPTETAFQSTPNESAKGTHPSEEVSAAHSGRNFSPTVNSRHAGFAIVHNSDSGKHVGRAKRCVHAKFKSVPICFPVLKVLGYFAIADSDGFSAGHVQRSRPALAFLGVYGITVRFEAFLSRARSQLPKLKVRSAIRACHEPPSPLLSTRSVRNVADQVSERQNDSCPGRPLNASQPNLRDRKL